MLRSLSAVLLVCHLARVSSCVHNHASQEALVQLVALLEQKSGLDQDYLVLRGVRLRTTFSDRDSCTQGQQASCDARTWKPSATVWDVKGSNSLRSARSGIIGPIYHSICPLMRLMPFLIHTLPCWKRPRLCPSICLACARAAPFSDFTWQGQGKQQLSRNPSPQVPTCPNINGCLCALWYLHHVSLSPSPPQTQVPKSQPKKLFLYMKWAQVSRFDGPKWG